MRNTWKHSDEEITGLQRKKLENMIVVCETAKESFGFTETKSLLASLILLKLLSLN